MGKIKASNLHTTLVLPRTLREEVRQLAENNERTFSAEVRHALRAHVRREQEGAARR